MCTEWKPVIGFEDLYLVSDDGQVRSLDRTVNCADGRTRTFKGRAMSVWISTTGYSYVTLRKDDVSTNASVHRLVVEAFVGPIPDGMHVCHNDGTRTNNEVSNLRIDTVASNQADRLLHGTHQNGEQNATSVLDSTDVQEIRWECLTRFLRNEGYGDIAERYGVARQAISRIEKGDRWSHLPVCPVLDVFKSLLGGTYGYNRAA